MKKPVIDSMAKPLTIVGAALLLTLTAVVAAWGYNAQQQERELQRSVLALVEQTSKALRAMLMVPGGPTDKLAREASAAQARVDALRRMDAARDSAFNAAADRYVAAGQDILRGQLEMKRARERVPARVYTLTQHVHSTRTAPAWPEEVLRLKEAVDDDFHSYRTAVEAYLVFLNSFRSAQTAIRPYVAPALLIDDETIERAKKSALDSFAAVNRETRLATDLDSFKPQAAAPRPRQASGRKVAPTRAKAQQKQRSGQKARSAQKPRSAQKARPAQKSRSATPQKATSGGQHGARAKSGSSDRSGKRNR